MRPPEVSLDLGTPPESPTRISSDFEEVPYPPDHWAASNREEELPLHYMNEEKARRRVVKGPGSAASPRGQQIDYEDEKDVYAKANAANYGHAVGSGRPRHHPPPPPTTIVCLQLNSCSS